MEELMRPFALAVMFFTSVSAQAQDIQTPDGGVVCVHLGSFSDTGKWHAEGSAVCSEGRQIKFFCNEVRTKDGVLHLKRESGEVLKLESR